MSWKYGTIKKAKRSPISGKKHQQNRTTSNFMTLPVFKPISWSQLESSSKRKGFSLLPRLLFCFCFFNIFYIFFKLRFFFLLLDGSFRRFGFNVWVWRNKSYSRFVLTSLLPICILINNCYLLMQVWGLRFEVKALDYEVSMLWTCWHGCRWQWWWRCCVSITE